MRYRINKIDEKTTIDSIRRDHEKTCRGKIKHQIAKTVVLEWQEFKKRHPDERFMSVYLCLSCSNFHLGHF